MSKNENLCFLGSVFLTLAAGPLLVAAFSAAKPSPLLLSFGVMAFLVGLVFAVRSAYLATDPGKAFGELTNTQSSNSATANESAS